MSMTDAGNMKSFEIKGWHVLAAMIGFFGVIFVVNGIFLYKALQTHTGVVSQQPYRKGLGYNERIAFERNQDSLGWQETLTLGAGADTLTFELKDKAGSPVTGLRVTGSIGRPSTVEHDAKLMMEEREPGRYVATFTAREPGGWLVDLAATRLDGNNVDRKSVV